MNDQEIKFEMRSLTIKQAEKWLQKIKESDTNAYRDLTKCLSRYDKTSDQFQCFTRMSQALFYLPELSNEINTFMDEGNKFIINRNLKERMDSFLQIVKYTRQDLLKDIMTYVNDIVVTNSKIMEMNDQDASKIVKVGIIKIVKDYPKLVAEAEKTLTMTHEEVYKKVDLSHLKNKVITTVFEDEDQEEESEKQQQLKKVKKVQNYGKSIEPEKQHREVLYRPKPNVLNFLSTSQQKLFIRQLQKKIGAEYYSEFIKILFLYGQNIISRLEFLQLIKPLIATDLQAVKDIIESRQVDRRRPSMFKPLSDIDFHILPRETHSYVEMPATYPHYAKIRTKQNLEILNNRWVSVPRGSEETFNVRMKNMYEMALNKFQDERYEFDLMIRKFRKTAEVLQSVYDQLKIDETKNVNAELNLAINLGVLQILYKNVTKEQKDFFEDAVESNLFNLVEIYLRRVKKVLQELEQNKKLYALKIWSEGAQKNFHKSLDYKNHEFKRIQKLKMRPQSYIDEINLNVQYLESRGTKRISYNPFEDKKQFFSVLNTFDTSCRQKRQKRNLATPKTYNLKQHRLPSLLPAMILAFEDEASMKMCYCFIYSFLENGIVNEGQKNRCKNTLKQIWSEFFKIGKFESKSLTLFFSEDRFFNELLNSSTFVTKTDDWIHTDVETENYKSKQQSNRNPVFHSIQQVPSEYSFEPPKNDKNLVFYASENFYIFLRFLYTLYERIIRMREIVLSEQKIALFQILYLACIKTKQSTRFEDSLTVLFGEHSYIFTTIYKVVQGVCKSLSTISQSPLQSYSFTLLNMFNQDVYLLLLNRYLMNCSLTTTKLMRFTYQLDSHLLYINCFNPYYKFNQQNLREYGKKLSQIYKKVQFYNIQTSIQYQNANNVATGPKAAVTVNNQQYYFEHSTNKLINMAGYEDIILGERKIEEAVFKKDLQKLKKVVSKSY